MSLCDFKLLTKADAAAIFGVCTKTIDNYIREGRLPPPVEFASREYWHPEDFRAFLELTFRRVRSDDAQPASGPDEAAPVNDGEVPAVGRRRATHDAKRDSNPVVRQQARQQARLRELNGQ
ncbi:helix-turn-helix transcriptional regulator [Derxia lacustris]|uniref:helix-turn-helix transcriptional regulator n=1 Tax=Derxia lacustris TaxID=764842 RepID=UPI000A16DEBD|nr:helix-turn-helix domain-containing protein [Derxia lacustris]